jgi:cytochrome P450
MNTLLHLEQELDPFPLYRQMRQQQPVFYDQERANWNIFRFEDVQRVLSEYEVFSSRFAGGEDSGEPFSASMIATDPPKHRQLRSLVTQAFTPRAVQALAPRIRQIVDEYLEPTVQAGRLDVIQDLGYPLPVIVIAEMMGIPSGDRQQFKAWSDNIVALADLSGEVDESIMYNQDILEMSAYFLNMIEQRRQNPGDDLISGLVHASIDGESLTQIELIGFCALLLVAGNETTTNLIGNAILTLAEHPEDWQRLRQNRALLPQAIEEVLRYRSPVQSMFRVTKQAVTLAGQDIPAGAPLVAWIGSANRDEAEFPAADRFNIERSPNKHLAFGKGIHYCLGAPLARLEAEIALGEMLELFETIELDPQARIERQPSLLVYGLKSLPVLARPAG